MMQHLVLPIDSALDEISAAVKHHAVVIVEAPPGAGKTTRVAPALQRLVREQAAQVKSAGSPGRVVLVEPRRIAARTAAARIAAEENVRLGEEVGYHVRFDRRVSQRTGLVVVTPGILLRELQSDGVLSDISVVLLDEFHERSLECDILLGMIRRIQESIRPDLRLVIMSATLNTGSLQQFLHQPPVISVQGQMFPVSLRYLPPGPPRNIVETVCQVVPEAARESAGDVLVFLPGVGEILQAARRLASVADKHRWDLLTLYGDLSADEQDRVLAPATQRKIILSTNVAETSLTIDGVRVVVDSGWARLMRTEPAVGLNQLRLEPISQASADQRAGRAGRTAPGICWRLWAEATHRSRPQFTDPEILRVDLAAAVLQLLCWGESQVADFPWLTPPREDAVIQAFELLERLDAIEGKQPTALGRQLMSFPVHPRLARLLLAGHGLGIPSAAALAAAMLSERDVFDRFSDVSAKGASRAQPPTKHQHNSHCDVTDRILALNEFYAHGRTDSAYGSVRIGAARQVERAATQFRDLLMAQAGKLEHEQPLEHRLSQALLAAMPDRVARRREAHQPRGLMVGGRGIKLAPQSAVRQAELFVCVDVDAADSEALVRQAAAIERSWLNPRHLREVDERFFHPTQGQIVTRRRVYWFDLLLEETPIATPLDDETARLLARAAQQAWHKVFPTDDKQLNSLLGRARWLSHVLADPAWPDLSDAGLQQYLPEWCAGQRDLAAVRALPWRQLIEQLLSPQQRSWLAREAPESFTLPSGRVVLLQYTADQPPILAARIQEFFGLSDTPRIAGGRVRLLLHLLAPNNRCQQITDDLASFWKNTYSEVRKQLRGRYPKHAWPENPLQAE